MGVSVGVGLGMWVCKWICLAVGGCVCLGVCGSRTLMCMLHVQPYTLILKPKKNSDLIQGYDNTSVIYENS